MNKLEDNQLNENSIALASLKLSAVGDELLIVLQDGSLGWQKVENKVCSCGRYGKTILTLRNILTEDETIYEFSSRLPANIVRARRVSAGVNDRTLRKMTSAAKVRSIKAALTQPEGEFENIFDVPLIDEGVESANSEINV